MHALIAIIYVALVNLFSNVSCGDIEPWEVFFFFYDVVVLPTLGFSLYAIIEARDSYLLNFIEVQGDLHKATNLSIHC